MLKVILRKETHPARRYLQRQVKLAFLAFILVIVGIVLVNMMY